MSDQSLILKAAALKEAAPFAYQQFLEALDEYTQARTKECVQAPEQSVRLAQGKAQQCVALVKLLRDSVETADRKK